MGIRLGDWKLDALVLADRPAENNAFLCVSCSSLDKPASIADALGRDEDTFRIQTVEKILETLAFLTDEVFRRYVEVVDEKFCRGMVHHRSNGPDRKSASNSFAHIHEQHR